MGKWTQQAQFEDTAEQQQPAKPQQQTQVRPQQQPPAQPQESDEDKPRKKIPLFVFAIGFGVFAIVVLFLCAQLFKANRGTMENPGTGDFSDPMYWNPSDPTGNQNPDDFWGETSAFSYTDEEKASLRAWGYTGYEIETNEADQVPAQDLIDSAKAAQEEARATLSNPESPEYQALLNSTWLGQQSVSLPQYTQEMESQISYGSQTLNCDYEKIEARGNNLYLKVHLPDGSSHFMECPFLRYCQLPDSGNIVVRYQTTTYNGITIIDSMEEVEVG